MSFNKSRAIILIYISTHVERSQLEGVLFGSPVGIASSITGGRCATLWTELTRHV